MTTTNTQEIQLTKPPSTMIMGDVGSGKSYSIGTFLQADLTVLAILTEPGAEDSIYQCIEDNDLNAENFHWIYIPFANTSWQTLTDQFRLIQNMNYKDLADIKSGIGKKTYTQLSEMYGHLQNFVCPRTGKVFGDVTKLDHNHALVLDSISGLNKMCMSLVVGAKPTAHQGEWGVAMNVEEGIIDKFTSDMNCFFACTAHLDRVRDEVLGTYNITPMFIGNKLAPKMGRMFTEIVLAKREENGYVWSNMDSKANVKHRFLTPSATGKPSFVPLVEAWRKRNEVSLAKLAEHKSDNAQ